MPFARFLRAAPLALLACLVLLPVAPARADTATTGGMSLEGVVDFASGSWQGVSSGSLSGRHTAADGDDVEWSLLLIAPATADFDFVDPVGLGPCVSGVAAGTMHITGTAAREQAEVFGAYFWGGPLPR
nr:hypothetical protein [Actinomycetota bacterium]